MLISNLAILGIVILTSFLLTGVVKIYAHQQSMIDMPNNRSSHSIPTPRGGGLGIVVTFLAALLFLYVNGYVSKGLFVAFFGGCLLIAAIGL